MNLARAIHLDESDTLVFHRPARTGEWLISGGFEFSNWAQADLSGKARQAFANGWLGLESFGRATLAAVTQIGADELDRLADDLAQHFVDIYGAPDLQKARLVALEELRQMVEMCDGQDANTILTVARELSDAGVNESYRIIESQGAELIQITGDGCNS